MKSVAEDDVKTKFARLIRQYAAQCAEGADGHKHRRGNFAARRAQNARARRAALRADAETEVFRGHVLIRGARKQHCVAITEKAHFVFDSKTISIKHAPAPAESASQN